MNIQDFITVAKKHYSLKTNISENNFMCLALMRLIDETQLKNNYSNLRLFTLDDVFYLASFNTANARDPYVNILNYSKHDSRFMFHHFSESVVDNLQIVATDRVRDLVIAFNDKIQDIDSFFELNGAFSFDEISQLRQVLNINVSSMLPMYLNTDYNEDFESNIYNEIRQKKANFVLNSYYGNNNRSMEFSQFSSHLLNTLNEHYKKEQKAFTMDDIKDLSSSELRYIYSTSGLEHLRFDTLDESDMVKLINNSSTFLDDTFLGSLLKYDNANDVITSYFDHVELENIKLSIDLSSSYLLESPSLEDHLNQKETHEQLNKLFIDLYAQYPSLTYDIQDISIVKDKDVLEELSSNTFESLIDKFFLNAPKDYINDLGPNIQNRMDYMSQFRIYPPATQIALDEDNIKFVTANQFNVNGMLLGRCVNDTDYHPSIKINSAIIDPVLSDDKIRDLVCNMYDYAQRTQSILDIDLQNEFAWGSMNKDRFLTILKDVDSQYKNDVVMFLYINDKEQDKLYLASPYLDKSSFAYKDIPQLKMQVEKIIKDNINEFDTHIEFKIEAFLHDHRNNPQKIIKTPRL